MSSFVSEVRGGQQKQPLDVLLGALTSQNVQQLRALNLATFPVRYGDKFYKDIVHSPAEYTRFAYYHGFVVGAICSRVEPYSKCARSTSNSTRSSDSDGDNPQLEQGDAEQKGDGDSAEAAGEGEAAQTGLKKLYIMTLGVLAAYRRRGVGETLLRYVLENAEKDPEIAEIYLHVQTNNEGALRFYERFGFERMDLIEGYYKRIDPPDCYVVAKTFDRSAEAGAAAVADTATANGEAVAMAEES